MDADSIDQLATGSWEDIYAFFDTCDVVYTGPVCHASMDQQPAPFHVLQRLLSRKDAFHGFQAGIRSSHSIICRAYCVHGFRQLVGKATLEIEEHIADDTERFKTRMGSFASGHTLSELLGR